MDTALLAIWSAVNVQDTLGYIILITAALLVAYIFLMLGYEKVYGTRFQRKYEVVFGIPFILADVYVNYWLSLVFFDIPDSWGELVTSRLKRYKRTYIPVQQSGLMKLTLLEKFRLGFAVRVCRILNRFDFKGTHC